MLAWVRERGVEAVTVAVAYHRARHPRAKAARVVHRRDGVFLPLPSELWVGVRLRPRWRP